MATAAQSASVARSKLCRAWSLAASLVLLAGLLCPSRVAATTTDQPFDIGDHYPIPGPPNSMVSADFNSDGFADLALATSDTCEIWLNNGAGRFVRTADLGTDIAAVVTADFNGDGRADIAALGCLAFPSTCPIGHFSIHLGRGDGSFGPPTPYLAGAAVIQVGDLNGDRRPDIVVATDSLLSVFINLGDALAPAIVYHNDLFPGAIAIGDLNGDSLADVVVVPSYGSNQITIYPNLGGGTLGESVGIGTVDAYSGIVLADLDDDGWNDIVLRESYYAMVRVLWNDGNGRFSNSSELPLWGGPEYFEEPTSLAIADLQGDGRPDVVASSIGDRQADCVSLVINRGARHFESLKYYVATTRLNRNRAVILVADVDRQAGPDIVLGTSVGSDYGVSSTWQLLVLRNRGGLLYAGAADYHFGTRLADVQAVSFDGTGKQDLLLNQDGKAWLMRGNSDGVLSPPEEFPEGLGAKVVDVNRDGRSDLITSSDDTLAVLLCAATGRLEPPVIYRGGRFQGLCHSNRDAMPDLLVIGRDDTLSIRLNDGAGGFSPPISTHVLGQRWLSVTGSGFNSSGNVAADLDGDGFDELILSRPFVPDDQTGVDLGPDSIAVFHNDGNGNFVYAGSHPLACGRTYPHRVCRSPSQIIPVDLDHDGKSDLIVAHAGYGETGHISILRNRGDGRFDQPVECSNAGENEVLAVADFNMDSRSDFVGVAGVEGGGLGGELVIWPNHGDGTFADDQAVAIGIETYPGRVAMGDFNGDGKPDIAVGRGCCPGYPGGVVVFYNRLGSDSPTPTLLSLLESSYRAGRAHFVWYSEDRGLSTVTLFRKTSTGGWATLASISRDGAGRFEYDDVAVEPGHRYAYRLGFTTASGQEFSAPVEIEVPAVRLALEAVSPNPAFANLTLRLSLASNGPAEVQLLDVSGRRARTESVRSPMPGSRTMTFNRDRTIAPGVYWLRLEQGGHYATAKIAIVR